VRTLPAEDVLFMHVGAVVEIELESSMEIARAEAPGAENVTLSGRRATARWRLREDGVQKLSLDVFSTAGLGLDEPVSCGVRTLPDAPPTIELDEPVRVGPDDEVAPIAAFLNAAIPIRARAVDDVEVASVRCEV